MLPGVGDEAVQEASRSCRSSGAILTATLILSLPNPTMVLTVLRTGCTLELSEVSRGPLRGLPALVGVGLLALFSGNSGELPSPSHTWQGSICSEGCHPCFLGSGDRPSTHHAASAQVLTSLPLFLALVSPIASWPGQGSGGFPQAMSEQCEIPSAGLPGSKARGTSGVAQAGCRCHCSWAAPLSSPLSEADLCLFCFRD